MKTILITGSTDGIGKLTAAKLANEGHTIYLHGRNPEKLTKVVAELKESTNNENIKGVIADFSELGQVQQLAEQLNQELPKLDVLINNAGIFNSPVAFNSSGLDIRFTINYFAPYLLTNLLLPILQKSIRPRIINLSSAAQAVVSKEVLLGKKEVSVNGSYAQSKLALTMWSFDLAKNNSNIDVTAVNPGSLLNTKMVQEAYGHHWSSADKGADILFELSVLEKYQNVSGKYFDNDKGDFGNAHPDAYNEEKINDLIEITRNLLDDFMIF
ncbi:SDR family NAD(P)-dependent oxidoreductase [Aquimarina sp. AU474]|uniref:SDR family NAD(P)-dependent oxidoreductase n=1 Tax=Aquimarina sp. AU474 TaxID=2108529 RepID=UPI00190F6028|nr:SDR family NAD(P)-dependent oxidoreductase [Aquimarina sp. AU474]